MYSDTSALNDDERQRHSNEFSAAAYQYEDFKRDVLAWLKVKFGSDVEQGKKAIRIPANNNRRDVDVLVCARHLQYGATRAHFNDGIMFRTTDNQEIVNYPKQHLQNCTTKHQATSNRFKANVRILKNMRNRMIDIGFLKDGVAPSYFLEGMLSNVPNASFANSFQSTFESYMSWLNNCNKPDLTCANDIHWLLRNGHSVCWNQAQFDEFRVAAWGYWTQTNH